MIASISLDLDNKWSYMKTHGDAGWESFPTYLDVVVPRVLDFFDELGITMTFFVVGQDADRDENHQSLRSIADRGHEIGNHSYHHEPPLDFMGSDDETGLSFFPGMSSNAATKMQLARELLGWMSRKFECRTMKEHVERIVAKWSPP